MKLNNKGFAITSIVYSLLVLFLIVIMLVLGILSNRKIMLNKVRNKALDYINGDITPSGTLAVGESVLSVQNFTYSDDKDSDGQPDIGDKITFTSTNGSVTESFYVYSYENNVIKALAEYPLYENLTYKNSTYSEMTSPTGLQDARTLTEQGGVYYATAAVHGTDFRDYEGSNIQAILNAYRDRLIQLGATGIKARLISGDELVALGCSEVSHGCMDALDFVATSNFWTGKINTVDDNMYPYISVWAVIGNNYVPISVDSAGTNSVEWCRPVIEITVP